MSPLPSNCIDPYTECSACCCSRLPVVGACAARRTFYQFGDSHFSDRHTGPFFHSGFIRIATHMSLKSYHVMILARL